MDNGEIRQIDENIIKLMYEACIDKLLMGDFLQENGFGTVWLVGKVFGSIDSPYRKFANVEEVKAALATEQPQGQYILIKGSNSNRLFELPPLL